MTRSRQWAGMALLISALGLAGCGGASSTAHRTGHSSGASPRPSVAVPSAGALTLVGPQVTSSSSGAVAQPQAQAAEVVVTNPGERREVLQLELSPAGVGAVSPAVVTLPAHRSVAVHVIVGSGPSPVRLVEVSRQTGREVAALRLR